MDKSVLTIRVPAELQASLGALSKATKRSKAFLATEAIARYITDNAWQVDAIDDAIANADEGILYSHDRVARRLNSW